MTKQELIETIQAIENGLAMNPTGEMLERLTNRLHRARQKLEDFDQKKSQYQPVEKSEQLSDSEKIKRAVLNPSNGIPALNETPEKLKADKLAAIEKSMTQGWTKMESILSAPTKANQNTIPVLLLGWDVPKEMNQAEIKAEARRYFQAVFTSKKFKKVHSEGNLTSLWEGKMYCNLWALCEAYNIISGYRLEMEQLLNSYWSFSDENKAAAVDLAQFLTQPQP